MEHNVFPGALSESDDVLFEKFIEPRRLQSVTVEERAVRAPEINDIRANTNVEVTDNVPCRLPAKLDHGVLLGARWMVQRNIGDLPFASNPKARLSVDMEGFDLFAILEDIEPPELVRRCCITRLVVPAAACY